MKMVPLVGKYGNGKFAQVDDEDYERVVRHRWFVWSKSGYVGTNIKTSGKWRQTNIQRFVTGCDDPKMYVDHRNHDPLDNRKDNLRVCTPKENSRNRLAMRGASSKYHGAHWCEAASLWRVRIRPGEHLLHVGYFRDEVEAAMAYDFYALRYYGEFACLNFPDFDYSAYEVRRDTRPRKRKRQLT